MTRPTLFLVLAVVFTLGAVWWHHGRPAEAAGKKAPAAAGNCTDELARTKQELAAAREDARKAREEARVATAQVDKLTRAEQERIKRLQDQLGTEPVSELK
jgi:hypothetical protein